jgi:hypothetical protein
MAEGLTVPQTREEQLAFLAGKSPEEILATAAQLGLSPNVLLGAGILNESQLEATIQQPPEEAAMTEYNALINPPQVGSYIEGLTESQSNPLDRFTQGVSTDKGFDPLNPPMFKAPTPQQPTDTRSNPFQAPEGTADAIRAKLAALNTQGQANAPVGETLQAILAEPSSNTVEANAQVVPEERIRGLQFPSGVSGVEPSGSRPQGNDQARMIAEQAARLNQAQRIKDSQAQSVQPPQNETVAKLRDENRDPNRMSLAEVRKIPGYEDMEMNEERTVNRTLNIFPRTPPEVSKQIKALFRNNKPVEAQELANQYKPEPQRDPYVAMQGDLIKMPEQRPVGIEQLVAAGTNGVGMSGVGADIKAGMEEPPLTDLQRLLGVTKKSPERIAEIREQQGQAINDYEAALPERSIGPAPTMLGGLTRGSQFMTGIAERERRESPQGSYAQLIEDTENERIRVQNIKLSDLEATIARVTENEDTTNPLVQKKLANLAKQKQKLTGSIATGSTSSIAEDAAKAEIGPSSTLIDADLEKTAAQGRNTSKIQVVPNADPSFSDSATGTTLAGLDLDKDTGSSILDNQSGDLSDDPYSSLTGLRGQQEAIAKRRKAEAVALNKEEEKYKELLENRQRPTLSYDELIRESEKNMATQLADIKDEKGTQALIALGAGIASGNLAKGLSDAGKAVATSNAQKRALEARQQAVRMGFRKSEVDAVYQNQVAKENDKLEGMKFSLDSLRRLNASTADAEQIVLNFDTGLETTLAKLQQSAEFKAEDRAKQDALNRRAVLEYVNKSMDLVKTKLMSMTDAEQRDLRNSFLIQGSSYAQIPVPDAALAGSTTSTASPATTTIGGYSVTQKQ